MKVKVNKFNITKAGRKYQDNQGQEKTQWDNVGTYTEFVKDDGTINRVVEIPAIGLNANVFPIKPKVAEQPKAENKDIEYPEEEINPEDIPF